MTTVVIMRGLPGSGKSRIADMLCRCIGAVASPILDAIVVSADHYRDYSLPYQPADSDRAHDRCHSAYLAAIMGGVDYVIVDNTNIHNWEICQYIRIADRYGCPWRIVETQTPAAVCISRRASGAKKIPAAVILRMAAALKKAKKDRPDLAAVSLKI